MVLQKKLQGDFETALTKVTAALKKEGFVVLKSFDLKETLKSKMNVDCRKYKVPGACNPYFKHQALLAENSIGVMLPCDVIVQEYTPGNIEIPRRIPLLPVLLFKMKNWAK